MDSATDEVPAKRRHPGGREKTQIPNETMLQVLLWLDRFDLDGPQITNKLLRTLVDNKKIPLRTVEKVRYICGRKEDQAASGYGREAPLDTTTTLSIFIDEYWRDQEAADVKLQISKSSTSADQTDRDVQKAASYLSSCFVRDFIVGLFRDELPRNSVIAAPVLVHGLTFCLGCNFDNGEEDTLSETLKGINFQALVLAHTRTPVRQIDDNRLQSLRRRGCNSFIVLPEGWKHVAWDEGVEKFPVTEEGILDYCFTLDDDLPVPGRRYLCILRVDVTPAFFNKVVQASSSTQLECNVELHLLYQTLDVSNLDIGVLPSHGQEYDQKAEEYVDYVSYNIHHGNGIRLLIHFKPDDGKWNVIVRHGKTDHEEFFAQTQGEEEDGQKSSENDSEQEEHA